MLSPEKLPMEEKERGRGSCLDAKALTTGSSLAAAEEEESRKEEEEEEKRVRWGRDSVVMSLVEIWRRAKTFQALRTWFSRAGSK